MEGGITAKKETSLKINAIVMEVESKDCVVLQLESGVNRVSKTMSAWRSLQRNLKV